MDKLNTLLTRIYISLENGADRLKKDSQGLSTVEYIIILILIAVVAISLWKQFGEAVTSRVTQSTGAVNGM